MIPPLRNHTSIILTLVLLLVTPSILSRVAKSFAQTQYWNDPTSAYFDASRAYQHRYSAVRHDQADAFLDSVQSREFKRDTTSGISPWMCVGTVSIRRPEGVYIRTSIGSLLAQLRPEERDQIHLIAMIAHIDPNRHPVYNEGWLHNVADEILLYDKNHTDYAHIVGLEAERDRTGQPDREKHLWDYTYLMRECKRRVPQAEYVLLLEDDVLASDGWFHRVKAALQEVESVTKLQGAKSFFYLRLFYTERDWSLSDHDKPQLRSQTFLYMLPLVFCAAIGGWFGTKRQRPSVKLVIVIALIYSCSSISRLVFQYQWQSGRFSALKFHTYPSGVLEMPVGGCCAQAIVYPISTIEPLTEHYMRSRIGFVDSLAEELAVAEPERMGKRWAISPALFQHIGGKSSKGDNWGSDKPGMMAEAEKIWNFAFETQDQKTLAEEHERVMTEDRIRRAHEQ